MGFLNNKGSAIIKKFIETNIITHLVISALIRLILISYGIFHDNYFEVPYTDIDYKVFTDAAKNVLEGNSPYNRSTYRYSPIIAYLLIPNLLIHNVCGKLIFCTVDLIVAYLIYRLVYKNVKNWMDKFEKFTCNEAPLYGGEKNKSIKMMKKKGNILIKYNVKNQTGNYWAQRAMLMWLYNPLTIAISTRGNSDSLSCLLVLLTLTFIQFNFHPFYVGLIHGFSIHFRIYPIIYSLLYYVYYSNYSYYFQSNEVAENLKNITKKNKKKQQQQIVIKPTLTNNKKLFRLSVVSKILPNLNQILLICGTFSSLIIFTLIFYYLYGYKYLYESIIYHFIRVDIKHNFSLYFYLQYLTAFIKFPEWYTGNLWQPILINLPPIILLINFSIRYGLNKFSLNFGILAQTITFVIYNKVITSQYFVWILGILPLCIWQIKLTKLTIINLLIIWFLAQAAWLLPAYLLEFRGENTFLFIWIQSVSLFCAHIGIFGRLIKNYILPMGQMKNFENILIADAYKC